MISKRDLFIALMAVIAGSIIGPPIMEWVLTDTPNWELAGNRALFAIVGACTVFWLATTMPGEKAK